jgi:hypothetical protein
LLCVLHQQRNLKLWAFVHESLVILRQAQYTQRRRAVVLFFTLYIIQQWEHQQGQKQLIDVTDKEIDRMVYALNELTEEENKNCGG